MFEDTECELEWARQRLPALLASVEQPELLRVLRGEPPAGMECGGVHRPRLDLRAVHDDASVSVDVWVWSAFADLYREDTRSRTLQVPSPRPPRAGTRIDVDFDLPDGAGRLRLEAEVARTSSHGFELRIQPQTAEVELIMRRLTEARGAAREARWVEGLRRELRARLREADARVLGLSPSATPQAIQGGYARVRQAWETLLLDGPLPEAMRPVLVEYGSLLAQVCARLVTPKPVSTQKTGPAGVRLSRPPAASKPPVPPQPVRSAPYRVDKPMRAEPSTPSRARLQNARRFTAKLGPRVRPKPSEPERPAKTTALDQPQGLAKVHALIVGRAYDEAEAELCALLQADPHQERVAQLLQLVRARRAATARDFCTAKRIYETLLRRVPGHAAAKKELIMVSALA